MNGRGRAARIGCSGWNYDSWKQPVYGGAPASRWLQLYAEIFDTVEVNATFYRLPTRKAVAVAGNILGEDRPYTPVPYFWTNQFDARIHVHGTLSADAEVSVVEGDPAEGRFVAEYRRGGAVTGVLGWNMPKQARLRRRDIAGVVLAGSA